ncbi:MAG: methylmalonyl-CoA epimerase [Phycisphaerales bacterium]|nr:methylmalonyl-CoA epimerase [Phycisphaerales bacterium]
MSIESAPISANIKAVNHIGIAVRSLDAQRSFYEGVLGARFEGVEEVADQHVRVAFYLIGPPESAIRLELLEPTSPESPIAAFIEKRGEGLHHVAYTVDNLQSRLDWLKSKGIRLIDERPRVGAHSTNIAFIHPKSSLGVLTELCEVTRSHHAHTGAS